jgi:hypothetical protein
MEMRRLATLFLFITSAGVALAGEVHVHGRASLDIAVEDGTVDVQFEAPAMDLAGFEHSPRNAEEQAAVQRARATLASGLELLGPSAPARCVLAEAEVESALLAGPGSEGRPHGHEHGGTHEEGHADFEAHYRLRCANPAALEGFSTRFFAHFPRLAEVRVQYVVGGKQGAAKLTAARPRLALPR